jgi:hypothetical protein
MAKKKPEPVVVDDGIPAFLKISQAERKEAWKRWIAAHPPVKKVEFVPEPVAVTTTRPKAQRPPKPIGNPEDKDFFHPASIIRVLLAKNPSSGKRKERVDVVFSHHGKSVQEFLDAGGNPTTLKNCEKSRWVKVEEP